MKYLGCAYYPEYWGVGSLRGLHYPGEREVKGKGAGVRPINWTSRMRRRSYVLCLVVFATLSVKAAETERQDLPDLDVTFIERTPRYVPGPWVYPGTGPRFMGVGNTVFRKDGLRAKHKQWPDPGPTASAPSPSRTGHSGTSGS